MKIEDLKKELETENIIYRGTCHDCSKQVEVTTRVREDGAIAIEGGSVYKVKQGLEELLFFKCDACFAEDPILRNFKVCEVYSRIVGYLRPIQQWNKGKKAEFEMRKEFVNVNGK